MTRVFDAPVELVWDAWTVSEQVQKWWGPYGFTCPVARMHVRMGGTSLVCMDAPGYRDHCSTWPVGRMMELSKMGAIFAGKTP